MSEIIFGKNKLYGHVIENKELAQRVVRTTTFASFLEDNTTRSTLKTKLTAVIRGESHNILAIAAAVRHIFAHGKLSAHANRCSPGKVDQICGDLTDNLFLFMDNEFKRKVGDIIKVCETRKGYNWQG